MPGVIITGGAKGIGFGIASVFAESGYDVAIIDQDREAGQEAVRSLHAKGVKAMSISADVSIPAEVERAMHEALDFLGSLHALVNNVGMHNSKGLEACSLDDWDLQLDVNLRSTFLTTKLALDALKATRGSVVFISSMVSVVGQKDSVAYTASKGGMNGMVKAMALDVAPYGIRVNAICPGFVETPLLEAWLASQPDPDATREEMYRMHPLGTIPTPREIGEAAFWLASDKASAITGVILPVDGGVTLGY